MILRLNIIRCFAFYVYFPRDQSMFHVEHCVFVITQLILRTAMLYQFLCASYFVKMYN